MSHASTLRDVAKKAGVHHTTASRALRGHSGIPPVTRDRLRALAAEMGYRANPLVSAWMSHRRAAKRPAASVKIAFLVRLRDRAQWEDAPSFTRYYRGAEARARELGFEFEELWLGAPGMTQARINRALITRRVDGVIVGSSAMPRSSLRLDWPKFAAVAQGFSLTRPALSCTANNYAHTIESALRELRHLGYRRIGYFITPVVDARWSPLGPGAFLVYQRQIPSRDRVPPFRGDVTSKAQFHRWVRSARPEAILTIHIAAEPWLAELGLRIPADIGVAYADWNAGDTGHAAGVDHQLEAAGAAAVDLLAAQLHTNERGVPAVPVSCSFRAAGCPERPSAESARPRRCSVASRCSPCAIITTRARSCTVVHERILGACARVGSSSEPPCLRPSARSPLSHSRFPSRSPHSRAAIPRRSPRSSPSRPIASP